ncbi:alpha/beta hydrolase [Chloroflexota bacterium]
MRKRGFSLPVDGLSIRGELFLPEDTGNTRLPAVILCHGIPSGRPPAGEQSYPTLAERFCQEGFITTAFNFRGAGRSEGNLDMLGWARDLKAILDYLWEAPEIDRRWFYLMGSSAGAAVAVYLTAQDTRISALITLACPADFSFLLEQERTRSFLSQLRTTGLIKDPDFPPSLEQWRDNFFKISPIEHISKISPRPLLLIHGELDEVVPLSHAHALFEKAQQPKELILLPGGSHRLRLDERAVKIALQYLVKREPRDVELDPQTQERL